MSNLKTKNFFIHLVRVASYIALCWGSIILFIQLVRNTASDFPVEIKWVNLLFYLIPISIILFIHPIENETSEKHVGEINTKRVIFNLIITATIVGGMFLAGILFVLFAR
jgi:hypothetical protein